MKFDHSLTYSLIELQTGNITILVFIKSSQQSTFHTNQTALQLAVSNIIAYPVLYITTIRYDNDDDDSGPIV